MSLREDEAREGEYLPRGMHSDVVRPLTRMEKQTITPGIGGKFGHHRKKGTPNKVTKEVKEVIARCFTNIGGEEAFAVWAMRNPTEFYKIYAKLLPISLQADITKSINVTISPTDAKL